MTTSDESWSTKLRQISELELPDHSYLNPEHNCYFFGEYTARKGWKHSKTNQIIHNIKKHPNTRGTNQWKYKNREIRNTGKLIRLNIKPNQLRSLTIVPAPPSNSPTDPNYDDRIFRLAKAIGEDVDVRPLLESRNTRPPAHLSSERPGPDSLFANLSICDEQLDLMPVSDQIIVLDDLIVSGATFVACRNRILTKLPNARISGVFVARRVPERTLPSDDFDDFDF